MRNIILISLCNSCKMMSRVSTVGYITIRLLHRPPDTLWATGQLARTWSQLGPMKRFPLKWSVRRGDRAASWYILTKYSLSTQTDETSAARYHIASFLLNEISAEISNYKLKLVSKSKVGPNGRLDKFPLRGYAKLIFQRFS